MTSPISQFDRALLALRAQGVVPRAAPKVDKPRAEDAHARSPTRPHDAADFVIARIRSIRQDDPHQRRRVFRAYLEGRLMALAGADALNDPVFQNLIDQVQGTMERDAALARAIDRTIDLLLQAAAGSAQTLEKLRKTLTPPLPEKNALPPGKG